MVVKATTFDMGGGGDAEALPRTRGLSAAAKHHIELRSKLLEAHPELRALSGPQPLQLLPVLALLCARWGLAYLLRDASLPAIVLTACTAGCWLVHALGTYVHEQGHRLIVRAEPWATAVDVLIEAAITSFGTGTGYQHRHVNFHHRFLGDYEWDWQGRPKYNSKRKDGTVEFSIVGRSRYASGS